MIHQSQNNQHIYQLLEEEGTLPADFSIDQVILFEEDDCFCVVAYVAESRNFYLWQSAAASVPERLSELHSVLQDSNRIELRSLTDNATRLLEEMMHSGKHSSFYFDAH